jgi:phosphatidylglycerol:prolipoprotein diacylglycerol transferase
MPNEIDLGFITIKFYGIILMLGALAGAFLAEREARRRGFNTELVWDGLIWVLIGGIIGARLWHVFTPPPSMIAQGLTTEHYLTHPLDLINTRMGGLGIPGAVIGGVIALYFFSRRRKLNFLVWTDIAAPAVALGQAIGRWGNFFNQELYGRPTDLPWAITIEPQYRLPEFANVAKYHPLFLYESLWNFANMLFLLWLSRTKGSRLLPGDVFLTYLITYPFGRFFLEFLRLDYPRIGTINTNQTVMLVVMVAAAALLFWRHRKKLDLTTDISEEL